MYPVCHSSEVKDLQKSVHFINISLRAVMVEKSGGSTISVNGL